ncbi:MAG TPA: hypothetical protein VGA64_08005 [Candidatus Polarisedimenticolia bacterium]
MKLSRRNVTRVLAGLPLAGVAGLGPLRALYGAAEARAAEQAGTAQPTPAPQATPGEPEETPLARFLSKQGDDLSGDERRRVRKQVSQTEQALREVRAYVLGNDVPPSGSWKPLRSKRAGGAR